MSGNALRGTLHVSRCQARSVAIRRGDATVSAGRLQQTRFKMARLAAARTFSLAVVLLASLASADEGMWTLDNLPQQKMQERYGFTPTAAWIEHVQKACVNFGGGSGAFVSAQGLTLTNHHVALNQLQKMSSKEHNYLRDGFFAHGPAEEMRCPDLELKVLWSMEDITARVTAAIDAKALLEAQNAQRKAVLAQL